MGILVACVALVAATACRRSAARGSLTAGGASTMALSRGDSSTAPTVGGADSSLVRAARDVLPSVESESGLSLTHPLAVARTTRARLESYLLRELERDLPPARARAVTAAYARFGLVPDTLDLRGLMRKLYLEQVVGYYDARRDTLYVRQGVSEAEFEPVLVHEMTHALQDEHMNLDSLMRARQDDNDGEEAARAALEGQATYVMLEWQLRKTVGPNADLTKIPALGSLLSGSDVLSAGTASMPVLAAAPPLIRRSLIFPYLGGLAFVQAFWKARPGRPAPLGANMPASTEQVMHPGRFLSTPRDAPTRVSFVTDSAAPAPGWAQVYENDLGEFETRFYLSTFLGDTAWARSAANGWDGDRFRLLRRCGKADPTAPGRGAPGPGAGSRCPEALVWASVWDTPGAADAFATAAYRAMGARYGASSPRPDTAAGPSHAPASRPDTLRIDGRLIEVRRAQTGGRPTVLVLDLPAGVDPGSLEAAEAFTLQGGG